MNETDSKSKGMPQMTEIKPNEKLGICTFCANKNGIENKIVTCVSEFSGNEYADSKKQISLSTANTVQCDSIEWNIFLCHSCIVDNRKKAFFRASLTYLGTFLLCLVMAVFGVPFLYTQWLPDLNYQPAFHTIASIFLILVWVASIIVIISSPIICFIGIKSYRTFKQNISNIKEEDKEIAFIEAGQRILDHLTLVKNSSKFNHLHLPKLPKKGDYVMIFPNKYVEVADSTMKILDSNDESNRQIVSFSIIQEEKLDKKPEEVEKVDEKDMDSLIENLKNVDSKVRKKVVIALAEIEDSGKIEPLIEALKDKDKRVREEVVNTLLKTGNRRAMEALINQILIDESKSVQDYIVFEISQRIDGIKASRNITKGMRSKDKRIRDLAIEAFFKRGDKQALEILIQASKEEEEYEYECIECHTGVKEEDKICPECGKNLEEKEEYECAECQTSVKEEDKICPKCGTNLEE
jgi:RNA polymerase subunit RPABC4/transcription elongation factor Spt4